MMTFLYRAFVFLVGLNFFLLPWYFNMQWQLHLLQALTLGTCLALTLSIIGFSLCIMALRTQRQNPGNPEARSNIVIDNQPESKSPIADEIVQEEPVPKVNPPQEKKNQEGGKKGNREQASSVGARRIASTPADGKNGGLPQKVEGLGQPGVKAESQSFGALSPVQNGAQVAHNIVEKKYVPTGEIKDNPTQNKRKQEVKNLQPSTVPNPGISDDTKAGKIRDLFQHRLEGDKKHSDTGNGTPDNGEDKVGLADNLPELSNAGPSGFVMVTNLKKEACRTFQYAEYLAHTLSYWRDFTDGKVYKIDGSKSPVMSTGYDGDVPEDKKCSHDYHVYNLKTNPSDGVYGSIMVNTHLPQILLNFQGTKPRKLETVRADIRPEGPGYEGLKNNKSLILQYINDAVSMVVTRKNRSNRNKVTLVISGHSLGASLTQLCFHALLQELVKKEQSIYKNLKDIGCIEINIANDPGVNSKIVEDICRLSHDAANDVEFKVRIIHVAGDGIQQAYPTAVGFLGPRDAKVDFAKFYLQPSNPVFWKRCINWATGGLFEKMRQNFRAHTAKFFANDPGVNDKASYYIIELLRNREPEEWKQLKEKCARNLSFFDWFTFVMSPFTERLGTMSSRGPEYPCISSQDMEEGTLVRRENVFRLNDDELKSRDGEFKPRKCCG